MKKSYYKILQILITILLVILVSYQAGLWSTSGRDVFAKMLINANLTLLIVAVVFGVIVNLLSAFKWYLLCRSQQLNAGFWRVFVYYVIGQFYNMFLPTSVGGDVVRSYQLGKFTGRQSDSLASVFVERYTGVLTLLLVAAIAMLTQISRLDSRLVIFCIVFFAIVLSFVTWFVVDPRPYQWMKMQALARWTRLQGVFSKLDRLVLSIDAYRHQPFVLAVAFLNSVLFYLVAVMNVYLCALVFNLNVLFLDVLIATPIIMLIMNIPLSFGNIGFMELGYSTMFALMGYGPELGLSIAILMRFKSLFDALIGGILSPIFVTQKPE